MYAVLTSSAPIANLVLSIPVPIPVAVLLYIPTHLQYHINTPIRLCHSPIALAHLQHPPKYLHSHPKAVQRDRGDCGCSLVSGSWAERESREAHTVVVDDCT